MQYINNKNGFTLIETLIALLLLSVGLLTFALLQAESLRTTQVSMQRTKAISFATDIIERMLSNRAGVVIIDDAGSGTSYSPYTVDDSAATTTGLANCSDNAADGSSAAAIDCTPQQIALYDIWDWKSSIANQHGGIVGGVGTICVLNNKSPYQVSITISWNDKKTDSSYTLDTMIL